MMPFIPGQTDVGSDAAHIGTSDAAARVTDAQTTVQPSVVADGGSADSPARSDAAGSENRMPNDGTAEYFTKRLSFRAHDKFFHCMLSYRVNSEGPCESEVKCGNDLAGLIWQSCSRCIIPKPQNQKVEMKDQTVTEAVM
jgi:hypothetical protein